MRITGSLQRKGNYYYAVLRVPNKDGTGTVQKWKSLRIKAIKRNKTEAQKALVALLAKMNGLVYSDKILFADWVDKWLEHHAREVAEVTMQSYRQYVKKHIGPYFRERGTILQDENRTDIQAYYDYLFQRGLSVNTVKHHKNVLHASLRYAVEEGIISNNPAAAVRLPSIPKVEHSVYTVEQVQKLLAAVKDEPLYPVIYIAANFGLRRSEVLGLEWSAIDLDAQTMTIRKTVSKVTKEVVAERTKTKSSYRILPIPAPCAEFFRALKHQQLLDRVAMGPEYDVNDWVCKQKNGNPFHGDYINHKFPALLKKYGLEKVTFHELRHTFASLMIVNGIDLKRVSELMGHSSIKVTADIYGHLCMEEKRETMDTFAAILQA